MLMKNSNGFLPEPPSSSEKFQGAGENGCKVKPALLPESTSVLFLSQ